MIGRLERQTGVSLGFTVSQVDIDAKLAKIHLERTTPVYDIVSRLVAEIAEVWTRVKAQHIGVLIVIDDLDKIAALEGLAVFMKATAEALNEEHLGNVVFLVAGATGVLEDLLEDHASIARLFDVIAVDRLSDDDVRDLIDNVSNSSPLAVETEARELMVELARGFPSDAQLIGAAAFAFADQEAAASIARHHIQTAYTSVLPTGALMSAALITPVPEASRPQVTLGEEAR